MPAKKKSASTSRKARATVPADESKRAKFVRLGSLRMTKALKSLSLLGNLSGSGYEYTELDVVAMRKSIIDVLDAALARFRPNTAAPEQSSFKFDP